MFAFGAIFAAYERTWSGKVAEKRMICSCFARRRLREVSARSECVGTCVLFDTEGLLAKPVLVEHVVGFVKDKNFDVRRIDDLPTR